MKPWPAIQSRVSFCNPVPLGGWFDSLERWWRTTVPSLAKTDHPGSDSYLYDCSDFFRQERLCRVGFASTGKAPLFMAHLEIGKHRITALRIQPWLGLLLLCEHCSEIFFQFGQT